MSANGNWCSLYLFELYLARFESSYWTVIYCFRTKILACSVRHSTGALRFFKGLIKPNYEENAN